MAAGNATFANESVTMADENAAFAGGMCLLRMETPLRGRSGGHTGTAPTVSFGWIVCGRLMSFGQIMSGRLMLFGCITRGWLVPFGEDCARMYNGDG